MVDPSEDRCADCGSPLTQFTTWTVPEVDGFLCDRCGRERLEIRMRLRFPEGMPERRGSEVMG